MDKTKLKQYRALVKEEPKVAVEIKTQIRIKEKRLEQVEHDRTEVDRFIAAIADSVTESE